MSNNLYFKIKDKNIPYKQCQYLTIKLKSHPEIKQTLIWDEILLSSDDKYIALKGINDYINYIYIWNKKNLTLLNYFKTKDVILSFDFISQKDEILIIYKNKNPIIYNILKFEILIELKLEENIKIKNILSWCFSINGKNLIIGTLENILIWNLNKKKIIINIEDSSPLKIFRNSYIITIKEKTLFIKTINKQSKIILQFEIKNIKNHKDLLCLMITNDDEYLYYSTIGGIFRINIENKIIEEVLKYDIIPTYALIDNDCKNYCCTDKKVICFYEENKGKKFSLIKDKFNLIRFNFLNNNLLILDDISLYVENINFLTNESEIYTIYLNKNPMQFKDIYFSRNSEYLLGIIDENNAILYKCKEGIIIKKFYNYENTLYFERNIKLFPNTTKKNYIIYKISDNLINIYDYISGNTIYNIENFPCYDIKINQYGNTILLGTIEGTEICRIYDFNFINEPISFYTNDSYQNKNTCVNITNDSQYILCLSINQNLFIFNSESKEIEFNIDVEQKYIEIIDININDKLNMFSILAKNKKNNFVGSIYRFINGDPTKITSILNCKEIIFSNKNENYIYYIEDIKNNLILNIIDYNIKYNQFEIKKIDDDNFLLFKNLNEDYFTLIYYDEDNNNYLSYIYDKNNLKIIAECKYIIKNNENILYLDLLTYSKINILLRKVIIEK